MRCCTSLHRIRAAFQWSLIGLIYSDNNKSPSSPSKQSPTGNKPCRRSSGIQTSSHPAIHHDRRKAGKTPNQHLRYKTDISEESTSASPAQSTLSFKGDISGLRRVGLFLRLRLGARKLSLLSLLIINPPRSKGVGGLAMPRPCELPGRSALSK